MAVEPEPSRPLLLDACCLINLAATGRVEELLRSIPTPIWVADLVFGTEALYLRRGGGGEDAEERDRIDLTSLRDAGLLQVAGAEADAELATFITLAMDLDNGEAVTGALALHRGADVATDDRKAIRVLSAAGPELRIWRTSELIKDWAERLAVPQATVREVLLNVQERARFRPRRGDPLREWWDNIVAS
ncbi:MAG: hypothetical protein H0W11_08475 [Gemmatimonadetes bacterium]|nr:hypothetical protein [Gemmatimonadota bacterium]